MRYSYFIVEGPHDLATLVRVIKLLDNSVREILKIYELPKLWRNLVPDKYPFDDNRYILYKNVSNHQFIMVTFLYPSHPTLK